jgi:hypothetical protein
VSYPRPGEVFYRKLVIRQEEPRGQGFIELARADAVRLRQSGRELTLEAEGLVLKGESPRLAMAQVGALLQGSGDSSFDHVLLTAPTCEVNLGAGVAPYALRELAAEFTADAEVPTVKASYRDASPGSTTRCELTLTRDRRAGPVRTTLAIKTMEGLPLSARVLDPLFDSVSWLGADAQVEGSLTLRQEGAGDWEAEFRGHLLEIDLSELVGRRFPNQRLVGKAKLKVESSRWADRPGQGFGWVEARGELTSGPGMMGLGLIQALSSEMKFRKGPRLARIVSAGIVDLEFQALGFSFAMTPDGEIKVGGGLGNDLEPNAVIVSPIATLAYAPEGAAHVRGLIKALFPPANADTGVMVPLTEKSRLLLCLPVGPGLASRPLGGN